MAERSRMSPIGDLNVNPRHYNIMCDVLTLILHELLINECDKKRSDRRKQVPTYLGTYVLTFT